MSSVGLVPRRQASGNRVERRWQACNKRGWELCSYCTICVCVCVMPNHFNNLKAFAKIHHFYSSTLLQCEQSCRSVCVCVCVMPNH